MIENAGKYLTMLNLWKHCFIGYLIEKKLANIQYFFFLVAQTEKGKRSRNQGWKRGEKNEINNIGACENRNSWLSYIIKTTQKCVDTRVVPDYQEIM